MGKGYRIFTPSSSVVLSVSFHHCFILLFPCQYHSTNVPHFCSSVSIIPPTLHNSISPVSIPPTLHNSIPPVSTIPPTLHTSVPLSVSFHQRSTIQFPLSVSFHQCSTFLFPCQYHSTNAPQFNFPCPYHSTNAPYLFCLNTALLRRTSRRNLVLANKAVLCQIPADGLTEMYCHVVSFFKGLQVANSPHVYFQPEAAVRYAGSGLFLNCIPSTQPRYNRFCNRPVTCCSC